MANPPPLRTTGKNLRVGAALNLFLPGAGLIYLGRRRAGALLAIAFLICFVAELGLFIVSYGRYLSVAMSDDLMKNDNLERVGDVFPRAWLIAFAAGGFVVYLISMGLYSAAKRQFEPPPLL
ncbi:MAG: hypothetical protein QOF48_3236 [Verrucomicrobiota bacterium]|jgi:hypothetical protein